MPVVSCPDTIVNASETKMQGARYFCVYRMFSADGELLYIGKSVGLGGRLGQHLSASWWISDVASMTLEWFAHDDEAAEAERSAIRAEKPIHNKQHNLDASRALRRKHLAAVGASLGAWLDANGKTADQFAKEIGVKPSRMHSFIDGSTAATGYVCHDIETATGGAIKAGWWSCWQLRSDRGPK